MVIWATFTFVFLQTHVSFMPSVGLEFITQMGVYVPEYLETGLVMQTNVYHESNNNAQVTMNRNQIRLSLPAPKGNIQLFSVRLVSFVSTPCSTAVCGWYDTDFIFFLNQSNKLLSVSSGRTTTAPSQGEDRTDLTECQDLFSGLKLCTVLQHSNAMSMDKALYYPPTGETRWDISHVLVHVPKQFPNPSSNSLLFYTCYFFLHFI